MQKFASLFRWALDRQTWRAWHAARLGRQFDHEHGTDTQSQITVPELGITGEASSHAVHYEASTLPKLRRALKHLGVDKRKYDFIDIGSGKGLVVIEAAKHAFNVVIGLEISTLVHQIAELNVRAASAHKVLPSPIELRNMNALDYGFPAVRQVVYLYNPFDALMLRKLLFRLAQCLDEGAEEILIVYVNPVCKAIVEAEFAVDIIYAHRTMVIYRLNPSPT